VSRRASRPAGARRGAAAAGGLLAAALLGACAVGDEPAAAGSVQQTVDAPSWLLAHDGAGTWIDDQDHPGEVVHAWVDARVKNLRYHKRVVVDVVAPYEGGVTVRVLAVAEHRVALGDGYERWGTDAIEIYPRGPGGRALAGPVGYRVRLQHDLDGDGVDEMVATGWRTLHGAGAFAPPADDPFADLDSPVRAAGAGGPPALYLPPFDDAGAVMMAEIDRIIARHRADPGGRHTLHAAIFNITDPELVGKLIEAHRAGVEVRLVIDGRKLRPWYDWYDGDDRLLAAGVPLLGVRRPGSGAMHDKIALLDGRAVATGSFNWEWGARFENHENLLVTDRAELVEAYAGRFEALAGGALHPRTGAVDPAGPVSVSFAPDEQPHRVVGQLIDRAERTIELAMFTAKDVVYQEGGASTSLLAKLIAAHRRGVAVTVVVDQGIHEASEYHGVESPDDPSDEWLEREGIHVVRAENPRGAYASMHHKLVVIDRAIAVTGAFNWYHDAAFANDEDQIVWRDPVLARRMAGEVVDLLRQYDPDFDPAAWPQVTVDVEARCDRTAWGDGLRLVGAIGALGGWDPGRALALDGAAWPLWRGQLSLPAGLRLAHKLVVVTAAGAAVWEPGPDRLFMVPTEGDQVALELDFRQ
jgi:hypothetical protein